MLRIVGIMLLGVATGYLLRNRKIYWIPKLITLVIWLLLFVLGIAVGMDRELMGHLDTIGLQAVVLAFGGVAGSVLFAWVVYHKFFRSDGGAVSK